MCVPVEAGQRGASRLTQQGSVRVAPGAVCVCPGGGEYISRTGTETTIVGGDDTDLAAVISLLFERSIDTEDLRWAVRSGVFGMTMCVDTSEMITTRETPRSDLQASAAEPDVDTRVRSPADRETSRTACLSQRHQRGSPPALAVGESASASVDLQRNDQRCPSGAAVLGWTGCLSASPELGDAGRTASTPVLKPT